MEDSEIIQLLNNRSECAISELDKKYGNILSYMSYRILKNRMDVEEVLNDTFYAAWETIPPQKPNSLLTYLTRIMRNLSIKKYHKNTAKKRNNFYDVSLSELEDVFSGVGSVEEEYEAKELADAISTFLDGIDKKSRILFVRRYYFSDSIREISRKCAMKETDISVKLYRVRKQLKEYLKKEGYSL